MSDFEIEMEICRKLGETSRSLVTEEEAVDFIRKYGVPWWLEDRKELHHHAPIRLRT